VFNDDFVFRSSGNETVRFGTGWIFGRAGAGDGGDDVPDRACTSEVDAQVDIYSLRDVQIEEGDDTTSSLTLRSDYVTVIYSVPSQRQGDAIECVDMTDVASREGEVEITSELFGGQTLSISREGRIRRDTRPGFEIDSEFVLSVRAGDGSSLTMTLISDSESTVQVDIVGDGSVTSFVDDYRFEFDHALALDD